MNYADLKIGKLVQTVLRPLIISKATVFEVLQMQGLEYSKETFGIQYPLLLKTSSPVAEKHYYSELLTLHGETYRLCCEWFETATNNDRPYVEKWIREHEDSRYDEILDSFYGEPSSGESTLDDDWDDFWGEPKNKVEILPKDGIAIGEGQYKGREDLTIVEIPEGVAYIGRSAFEQCQNLKEVILPDSLRVIDDSAFEGCISLEKIKLPKGLRMIGRDAFMDCCSLRKINVPELITEIPISCFHGCTSLEKVEIQGNLRAIMDFAFYRCENLSYFSLYCRENLKVICEGAFQGCKNFVLDTLDHNVISGAYDVKKGKYHERDFFGEFEILVGGTSVLIDTRAFEWDRLTIRTFKGTAGAKMAQELGLKVEYVKDER